MRICKNAPNRQSRYNEWIFGITHLKRFYEKRRDERGYYASVNVEFHEAWRYASRRVWWNAITNSPDIIKTLAYVNKKLNEAHIKTGDFNSYYDRLTDWENFFPEHRREIDELRSRMVIERLSRVETSRHQHSVLLRNDNVDLSPCIE